MDMSLKNARITVEKKRFYFDFKENERGRFLRITEEVHGIRDTIIVPSPGLREFVDVLQEMIEMDEATAESQPVAAVE